MKKDDQVIIRISSEDKKFISNLGGKPADIWRLGFEKWIEEMPSELQKKREYHEKMLLQCNNKIAQCNNNVITKMDGLTQLCISYLSGGRSAINPTNADRGWLKARLEDMNISTDKFFEHARNIPKEIIEEKIKSKEKVEKENWIKIRRK